MEMSHPSRLGRRHFLPRDLFPIQFHQPKPLPPSSFSPSGQPSPLPRSTHSRISSPRLPDRASSISSSSALVARSSVAAGNESLRPGSGACLVCLLCITPRRRELVPKSRQRQVPRLAASSPRQQQQFASPGTAPPLPERSSPRRHPRPEPHRRRASPAGRAPRLAPSPLLLSLFLPLCLSLNFPHHDLAARRQRSTSRSPASCSAISSLVTFRSSLPLVSPASPA